MNRDLYLGFVGAVGLHAGILLGLQAGLFENVKYGVTAGINSVEVSLVAAPPDSETAIPQPLEEPEATVREESLTPVMKMPQPDDFSPPMPDLRKEAVEIPKVKEQAALKNPGQNSPSASSTSSDGGVKNALPLYLKNPAPVYPDFSRRKGEEGLVLLTVQVDADGGVQSVEILKSSGHRRLDEAAAKAIWKWRFQPARVGGMGIASQVEVPIRFELDKNLF